jgi:hypothetical protein
MGMLGTKYSAVTGNLWIDLAPLLQEDLQHRDLDRRLADGKRERQVGGTPPAAGTEPDLGGIVAVPAMRRGSAER